MSLYQQQPNPNHTYYIHQQQPPQQRPINQQARPNLWTLPNERRDAHQKSLSSSSMNVQELSQDLKKLKEQLKKLAQRGEEISNNKPKGEQVLSGRIKNEQNNQNHLRPNVSADQHSLRRNQASSNQIYYPQPPPHSIAQNVKLVQNPTKQNIQQQATVKPIDMPPSKRQKIYSFMQGKDRQNKPFAFKPFQKPNQGSPNRINIQLRLELQIKELKEKLIKAESELNACNLQKQKIIVQMNALRQRNDGLQQQLNDQQKKSFISHNTQQTYEQQQKKASLIIDKLQAQLHALRSSNRISFDQALKSQLEENKILKAKLQQKTDQLQQIKDDWNHQKKTNESLKSELTIQEMKASTELRGRETKLEILLNDKANELQTAKRALQTLDLKYRVALGEIRQKDEFIMNYIVGRAKDNEAEDIKKTLQKYTFTFPQNRSVEGLLQQQREIEQLKKQLQSLKNQ